MRMLKRSLHNASAQTFEQAGDDIAAKTAVSDQHPDTSEGMAAYRERREPRFNQWLEEPIVDGDGDPDWFRTVRRMSLVALPAEAPWRTMVELFEAVADRRTQPALSAPSSAGGTVHLGGEALTDVVARSAALLVGAGAGPGASVGIHLDNASGLEALVLHWAVQWSGGVAVPLGTRLALPEIEYIVGHAGVSLICSGGDHLGLARAASDSTHGARPRRDRRPVRADRHPRAQRQCRRLGTRCRRHPVHVGDHRAAEGRRADACQQRRRGHRVGARHGTDRG